MEENESSEQQDPVLENKEELSSEQISKTRVGFPPAKKSSPKFAQKLIILILAILIIGGVGFFIFGNKKSDVEISTEATPTEKVDEQTPTPTEVQVDKKEIKIQVFNGTGISGAAGELKKELEELGYTDIEVGNSDEQTFQKTQVTFDDDLTSSLKNEILDKLESLYTNVDSNTKSLDKFDIEIITGFPKGHTPTVTSKPKSTATVTPTSAVTGSPTPSLTSTPTPTP